MEQLYGAPERLERVAKFIVEHWEQRRAAMEGKAMVVTMSRDIAARLHDEIAKLRPAWANDDDDKGVMKVIMTGGPGDPEHIARHVRSKAQRKALADRFKDPADEFRLAIVVDMWLTGFDVPCAHTMYVDKPLAGHNLMQAIARVNRVYGEKPGGLIVDLIGLADPLADALKTYAKRDGRRREADQRAAGRSDPGDAVGVRAVARLLPRRRLCGGTRGGADERAAGVSARGRPRAGRQANGRRGDRLEAVPRDGEATVDGVRAGGAAGGDEGDRAAPGVLPADRGDDPQTPGRRRRPDPRRANRATSTPPFGR